ncbi:peptidoglycan-binding domain-containing protein [Pseudomonas fluorescens]|uniref:Uncharacterized protein n=1 Tax=Pseudomonas fluorescens TaxID=294 RepID=A0A423LRF2_PSEFL|nr:peptidoglycan-binding domain-containing protein [Pseudomonas fluorescens]RON70896.1 hypothetical protein BK671_05025 [Pseudomonas fluorescens]
MPNLLQPTSGSPTQMDSGLSAKLKAAGHTAQTISTDQPFGAPILACSSQQYHTIEVIVVDRHGSPVSDVPLELCRDKTHVLLHKTGPDGTARFNGLEESLSYQLTLSDLDQSAWQLLETQALTPETAVSKASAYWKQQEPLKATKAFTHNVVQGECSVMLADRFGHLPQTLWDNPANLALKLKRGSMEILFPGDDLEIPPRQAKIVDVAVKKRYRIEHKLARTTLSVRLLDSFGEPYKELPYFIEFEANAGAIASKLGSTDAQGFLCQPLPSDIKRVKVTVKKGEDQEIHEFLLGELDPIQESSGAIARLNNLGFPCNLHDPENIACAVGTFQWFEGLPVTGKLDESTRVKLVEKHLS